MCSRLDYLHRAPERTVYEAVRVKLTPQWRPNDAECLLEEAEDIERSQFKRKDTWVENDKAIKERTLKYARISTMLPCVLNYGYGVIGFRASSAGFWPSLGPIISFDAPSFPFGMGIFTHSGPLYIGIV